MKICAAQYRSINGNIEANIEKHGVFIEEAQSHGAELIVFPELSLIGYYPSIAEELSLNPGEKRLTTFQSLADSYDIQIAVGAPLKVSDGTTISMIIFSPNKERQIYHKRHLHPDELEWFAPGSNNSTLFSDGLKIAPAICYELSIPIHSLEAYHNGAELYMVSSAKTAEGVASAHENLSKIAKNYKLPVILSNSVGPSEGFIGAGGSACWNKAGRRIGTQDAESEALLIWDIENVKSEFILIK